MTQHWRRRKRGAYQRRQGPAFESCSNCSNGWIPIGKTAATRCSCWRVWRMQFEPQPEPPVKLPLPAGDL